MSVKGTALTAFTDDAGRFLLPGVPAGEMRERVFSNGVPAILTPARVTAGATTTLEIALTPAAAAVRLDRFVVGESRERSGAAIAMNEQRFAANIRNVVSSDEFGAVAERNVTAFLKNLPGITWTRAAAASTSRPRAPRKPTPRSPSAAPTRGCGATGIESPAASSVDG